MVSMTAPAIRRFQSAHNRDLGPCLASTGTGTGTDTGAGAGAVMLPTTHTHDICP